MINITKAAQEHFVKLLTHQEPGTQIRVFIINPGTPSAEGGVSYCSVDSIKATDVKLKFDKFVVYIDKISVPFLKNAEIDFVTNKLGSKLTLKAPNAKILKVTNNDPLIKRVEYIIQSQINPQLATHGGMVSLVKITDDKYVVLRFSGGCNGCSMVNLTLKEGIEKQLLNAFPNELNGVKDLTEHKRSNYSYY